MGRYKVVSDDLGFRVEINGGKYAGYAVARFWFVGVRPHNCPNAEREARALCRRLNAAAKKERR